MLELKFLLFFKTALPHVGSWPLMGGFSLPYSSVAEAACFVAKSGLMVEHLEVFMPSNCLLVTF